MFVTFRGVVDAVTNAGRVIALIDVLGRMTPVEFEKRQLTPPTHERLNFRFVPTSGNGGLLVWISL